MEQDRLSDLALLSIERETTEQINFDQVTDIFAAVKARNAVFVLTLKWNLVCVSKWVH